MLGDLDDTLTTNLMEAVAVYGCFLKSSFSFFARRISFFSLLS